MASWTDKPQSFNPYVAQQPVEAMVEVGMKKQQQYDEGVERIQNNINNIAGMDLARDVDKNYLQTKLNSLTTNLRTVAAGDFSNTQLTNSVMGMTKSLINDRNIKNALYSTKVLRKGQADQETARKAGKSSPENDSWWNDQASEYLNNQDINATFGGSYIEYKDVDKKLRELGDKIKEVDSSIDLPYLMDGDKPILDENNKPIINQALLRIRTKGTSAERLVNTFMDNLDEGDKQQLMITGVYHYKGASVDTFIKDTEVTYAERKKILAERVTEMEVKLATDDSLSPTDKEAMRAEITSSSEKVLTGLDNQKTKELEQLASIQSPEELKAYKYKLYTQKHLTSMATNMANLSVSQSIETNPYFQAEMSIKKLQFDVDQSNRRHDEWLQTFQFSQYKFSKEQERADRKEQKEAAENAPFITSGRTPSAGEGPTLKEVYTEIDEYKGQLKELNAAYGGTLFAGSIDKNKALAGLISQYRTNPGSIVDNNKREYVQSYMQLQKKLEHSSLLAKEVEEQTQVYDTKIQSVIGSKGGIINKSTGAEIYSAKDLVNAYQSSTKAVRKVAINTPAGTIWVDSGSPDTEYRTPKQKQLMNIFQKNMSGGYGSLTEDEKIIYNRSKNLAEHFSSTVRDLNNQKLKKQNELLGQRMNKYQETLGTINPINKQDMARTKQVITSLLGKFKEYGAADTKKLGDFNPAEVEKMMKSADVGFTFAKQHDGSARLDITLGGTVQHLPMTIEEFRSAFPQYALSSPVTEIKNVIKQSANKTTNSTGKSNPVGAYYNGWDLPLIKDKAIASRVRVDVEGAVSGTEDQYQIRLYYNDPNAGWVSGILNTKGFVSEAGLQVILDNIGSNTIKELIDNNNKKNGNIR